MPGRLSPVPMGFEAFSVDDAFWSPRLAANRERSIFTQWERYEAAGTIDNFRIAAGLKTGPRRGFFYSDSDLHKWADAACRILTARAAQGEARMRLAALVEEYAALMAAAQDEDGYLYTYNQVCFPGTRWKNLMIEHELYCHGHFIEACISHHEATGRDELLERGRRAADLIVADFLGSGPSRTSGHEEIELALVKLYRATGERSYLGMASAFLERRGRTAFFGARLAAQALSQASRASRAAEAAREAGGADAPAAGFDFTENLTKEEPPLIALRAAAAFLSGSYHQQHAPIRRQAEPRGHAVRWAYMMCGAAMLARETEDKKLAASLESAWERLVGEKMYVTGGMGALPVIEGFGRPYELDNRYSYSETCAAIGSVFWNRELLGLGTADGRENARYAELIEWQLFNAASAGVSLSGDSYFYRNPLSSPGGLERRSWYATACCPSNLSRLLADMEGGSLLGAYRAEDAYRADNGEGARIRLDQYLSCEASLAGGIRLGIASGLPWSGRIAITLASPRPLELCPRIPAWAGTARVSVDGEERLASTREPEALFGPNRFSRAEYLKLALPAGETKVELDFGMPITLLKAHPRVKADRGRVAVSKGPLVYCAESADNPGIDLEDSAIEPGSLAFELRDDLLPLPCGFITGKWEDGRKLTLLPYSFWGNRGPSAMAVWLRAH